MTPHDPRSSQRGFKMPPNKRPAIHRVIHIPYSWEHPRRTEQRIEAPENRLGLVTQRHISRSSAFGERQRKQAGFQINKFPAQFEEFFSSQSGFDRQEHDLPIPRLHHPLESDQFFFG